MVVMMVEVQDLTESSIAAAFIVCPTGKRPALARRFLHPDSSGPQMSTPMHQELLSAVYKSG
jgi:hypothetical protein